MRVGNLDRFFVKYIVTIKQLTKEARIMNTEEIEEKIEGEHIDTEFGIDFKFHNFRIELEGDEPNTSFIELRGSTIFELVDKFIRDDEFLSKNYWEIRNLKRNWNNEYDVELHIICCGHCLKEKVSETGFKATVRVPSYNVDVVTSVVLLGCGN